MTKLTKKAQREQAVRIQTIYNRSVTPKSQLRDESADAVALFLKKGGVIQECKPSRRGLKAGRKMAGKTSKGFVSGTGGFANGYPKKSVGA